MRCITRTFHILWKITRVLIPQSSSCYNISMGDYFILLQYWFLDVFSMEYRKFVWSPGSILWKWLIPSSSLGSKSYLNKLNSWRYSFCEIWMAHEYSLLCQTLHWIRIFDSLNCMLCNKNKDIDGDTSSIEEYAINNIKTLHRRRVIIARST